MTAQQMTINDSVANDNQMTAQQMTINDSAANDNQ